MTKNSPDPDFSDSLVYTIIPCDAVSTDTLIACANLFSEHYGVWATSHPRGGERVKMNHKRLQTQCLFDDSCGVVTASYQEKAVAHAFFRRFTTIEYGRICWVTQLVVNSDYRRRHVATTLIELACVRCEGCCLASSHPAAALAVERALGRAVSPKLCQVAASILVPAANIPYVDASMLDCSEDHSYAHTAYFVDHTEVNALVEAKIAAATWHLGRLGEGDEFFVFVPKKTSSPSTGTPEVPK
jgi:hypothetical protein